VGQVPRKGLYAWGCFLLVFVAAGVGLAKRGAGVAAVPQVPQPNVLFGIPGSGTEAEYPGGADTACTEVVLSRTTGDWRCLSWSVNVRHLAIVRPRRYRGACAHAIVDELRGAWKCLGRNPVPDDELPPDGLPALPTPTGS
jgi:hypothetical protein